MKRVFCFAFLGASMHALAQTPDSLILDSLLKAPQTIELTISTPQPRLKQNFTLSLDLINIRI